jgi:hypothetical protein
LGRGLRIAELIRKEFYQKGRIDYSTIEAICYSKKAFVKEDKISGAQGRILFSKNCETSIITINSDISYHPKKKFVLAHELGHQLMHFRKMNFLCNDNDLNTWSSNNKYEFEANEFAAELLMPKALIINISNSKSFSANDIINIANELGSSITSSSIQYTKYGHFPLCILVSTNDKIDWYSRSDDFYIRHFVKGEALPNNSIANHYFKKGIKKEGRQVCLATQWDPNQKPDKYFYEECYFLDSHNSVITYLWPCDDY